MGGTPRRTGFEFASVVFGTAMLIGGLIGAAVSLAKGGENSTATLIAGLAFALMGLGRVWLGYRHW